MNLITLTFCGVFCNLCYVFCDWHLYYRMRSYQRRDLLNRVYASDEERIYAVHRADQMQSSLGADFPSFVKPMLQSHVSGGFWLVRVDGLSLSLSLNLSQSIYLSVCLLTCFLLKIGLFKKVILELKSFRFFVIISLFMYYAHARFYCPPTSNLYNQADH